MFLQGMPSKNMKILQRVIQHYSQLMLTVIFVLIKGTFLLVLFKILTVSQKVVTS